MTAKMVAVKNIKPGSVLADAVMSLNGKVLLGQGVELTPRHIILLNTWDVQSVFVHADESSAYEEEGAEPLQETPPEADSADYLRFVQEYDSLVTATAQAFSFIQKRNIVPVPLLKETAGNIHCSIDNNGLEALNFLLVSDHKLADFISRHSVMVAFFAGIIARRMNWSEEEIKGVALAGLLHDVGNLGNNKYDDARPRTNIAEAARLLRGTAGVPNEVILGVLQHRECIDGSGFPTGVNGARIHPYAKIIAVADTFHTQAYRDDYANPFPVLDTLSHEMFGKLDTAVCHTFISQVRDTMINNKILLTDGRQAEIIFFHPSGCCMPIVRTEDGQIIDLSERGSHAVSRLVPLN